MINFKIVFPTGYNPVDVSNDNFDINVIFSDGRIFWCTIYTPKNILTLLDNSEESFFWATNMLIVRDLRRNTIRLAIEQSIENEIFISVAEEIGELKNNSVYSSYDEIYDFSTGRASENVINLWSGKDLDNA